MRRQENQPPRPTAGCLSVPLFSQQKRNRIPLTSAPSVNEFFSHSELMAGSSSAASHSTPGGRNQSVGPSSGTLKTHQWSKQSLPLSSSSQQYGGNRPSPGPAPPARPYGVIPHPYKAGNTNSVMGKSSSLLKQQDISSSFNARQNRYPPPSRNESTQSKPAPQAGLSQMGRQPPSRPPVSAQQYSQPPRPPPPVAPAPVPPPKRPSAPAVQPRKNSWKFNNSFEPQTTSSEGKRSSNQLQTVQPKQGSLPMNPAVENSLRILTAVIDGVRHWAKFKDQVSHLFEIFATLDSAVTLGRHGAKCFLMRDGKEVVHCIFYENEQVLPRLIRGQLHRCVGNYDRSRDVLVCVSIRAALPSELRNAQEAVKASDAVMRVLVKSLSEV